nr:hypothetical protein [Tanacetum cinerariifolium]
MTGEVVETKKKSLKAEDEEGQPASKPQVENDEYNLQRGIQMSLESLQAQGQVRQAYVGRVAIREPDSTITQKSQMLKARGKEVSNTVALEERTVEFDEGQVGSDPGKTPESRPSPELELKEEDQAGSDPGQSHVVQAGPNPELMHEDFLATVYPEVDESLKLTTEKQVHLENPPSSSRTLL